MFCINCFRSHNGEATCEYCQFPQDDSFRDKRALPVGSKLKGKYLIGRVLGAGGFGITYLAKDETLGWLIALKEFMPSGLVARVYGGTELECLALEDEAPFKRGLDRFFKEGEILAKFTHPGIVGVIDIFSENSTAYLAMKFLEGMTLKDWQDEYGNFSESDALAIMEFVTNALREVHGKHVVHRDIKPDNIYRATSGQILVLDFGGAKQIAGGGEKTQTDAHFVHGYTALEQYIGQEGNIGPWTDVYACGATLYKLMTGKVAPGALHRLTHDAPLDWTGFSVSENTRNVIARAMALKYAERIQSVSEFKTLLLPPTVIPPELPESESGPLIEPQREPVPDPVPPLPIPGQRNWRRFVLPISGFGVLASAVLVFKIFVPAVSENQVGSKSSAKIASEILNVGGPCAKSLQTVKFATPKMVLIPAGIYAVGSGQELSEVKPKIPIGVGKFVNLSAFELAESKVTVEQWMACVDGGDCKRESADRTVAEFVLNAKGDQKRQLPVAFVSWNDAQVYISWLKKKTGSNFRLASEVEWEYAARAGQKTLFSWGERVGSNNALCGQCDVKGGIDTSQAAPVKLFSPSQYGLYDMQGNLYEWVADCWRESHEGNSTTNEASCGRVQKGAAFLSPENEMLPYFRSAGEAAKGENNVGFRVACS